MRTSYILPVISAVIIAGGIAYLALLPHKPVSLDAPQATSAATTTPVIVQQGATPPPPLGTAIVIQPSGTHVTADVIAQTAPPAGYVEYTDNAYHFSFAHSPDGTVKVYNEGGGAETVVLENFAAARGMQVFVVPYSGTTISEQRFEEDEPSGVRTNVENTTLDGVQAVTFNGEDATLGPTREIWVIRNGYLYEITTFQGVGNWFTPIIQSWQWL